MSGLFDLRQAQAADAAGKDAAGKSTNLLNASFSAFDYAPSKLDHGRSFLMDDYMQTGRIARKREEPTRDRCWDVLHYQKDVAPFEPRQGFSETKFHSGFMRRQASQMPYLQQREEDRRREPEPRPAPPPRVSYNVLTSEGMNPSMDRGHGERRHVVDHREQRQAGMHADAPGGRLRDSTSRFFCTTDQLPHRPSRQHLLETDGLTHTKRTSTVIGVGTNPSQEIFSIGAREVLADSIYGIQRRRAARNTDLQG